MIYKIIISLFFLSVLFSQTDKFGSERIRMVRECVESRAINNQTVLNSMRIVQRHLFVPEKYIDDAYDGGPLPIGYGQTISAAYIVGLMTDLLKLKPGSKVLEIGTGSGYQAAVLSIIVDTVYTIEIIPELAVSAKKRLKKLGYKNVIVKNTDGYFGWQEEAPFDAIIVTAAAEYIPPPLIRQLKENGRMVIPVGRPFFVQSLMFVEKREGKIYTNSIIPVKFVPFTRND